jgi:hypothetical protein
VKIRLPGGRKCVKPVLMGFHYCINRRIRSFNWILAFGSQSSHFLNGLASVKYPGGADVTFDICVSISQQKQTWCCIPVGIEMDCFRPVYLSLPLWLGWLQNRNLVMKIWTGFNRASWEFHMRKNEIIAFRDVTASGGNPLPLSHEESMLHLSVANDLPHCTMLHLRRQ